MVTGVVAIRPPQRGLPRPAQPNLRDMPKDELARWLARAAGGPAFRADQLFEWLHRHRAGDFTAMTNLPAVLRDALAAAGSLDRLTVDTVQRAKDGTRKLRLRTGDGQAIESVLIPNHPSRLRGGRGFTLCISSMIGCSLACSFCATAKMGFVRNLSTWEIVDQVYRAQDLLEAEVSEGDSWSPRVGNLVFMGMGEPLHNYQQVCRAIAILTDEHGAAIAGRRITVSSAGLVPAIERFAREGRAAEVGIAISLNATTDAVRDRVMSINTRWPIAELLAAVRGLPAPGRRRVTFEYVLLADVNDSDADAGRLAALVGALDCHVNLIPFNAHPGAPYRRPADERIERFAARCRAAGLQVHLRRPRGDDIDAACGQLALRA